MAASRKSPPSSGRGSRKKGSTRAAAGKKAQKSGSAKAARREPSRSSGSGRSGGGAQPPFGPSPGPSRLWKLARLGAALAFAIGFAFGVWLMKLDRIVVERFEGLQFAVPSKVMSAPTILYPGLDWKSTGLRQTLTRLGYREQSAGGELARGRYRWGATRLRIHLHEFEHPTRAEPALQVDIALTGSRIASIFESPVGASGAEPRRGAERGAVLLEPELVGAYFGSDHEQRDLVRLGEVPRHLTDAIMSVEDRRFESHHGLDPRRIAGALIANLRAGGIRQGASTLTQQLVKNFFLTPERTFSRKFQEAVMAVLVELRYEKSEILESYLNEIYLGQRGSTAVHGVGEAARLYFGKRVQDFAPAESATLAAIIQSPNRMSPHRNIEGVTERRNLVLKLMHAQGRLSPAAYQEARSQPLRVVDVTSEADDSRYFLDYLRRQLPEVYDAGMLAAAGLQIHSTLDPRLQRAAAVALREGLAAIERRVPKIHTDDPLRRLQGCIVALRPQTGEVLALVGGRDYRQSQFNRCTDARRQVGSLFKPVVYAAALESRDGTEPVITLASYLDDSPFEVSTPSGPWLPRNYDRRFRGRVSVREAIERSLNVPAARLAQQVGINNVLDMATRLGVTSAMPGVPSLALGTAELSPVEVARVYATLASGGVRPWPHSFEDVVSRETGTLDRRELRFERVISPGTAYLVTSLLEGVVERGTATRLRSMGLRGPIAGKTGTTGDEHDLWFAGYTPELVAVVWVGFDEPRAVGQASSSTALPIWGNFVKQALGDEIRGAFLRPAEVRSYRVASESDAFALAGCGRTRTELFLEGTEPEEVCPGGADSRPRGSGSKRGGLLRWLGELL